MSWMANRGGHRRPQRLRRPAVGFEQFESRLLLHAGAVELPEGEGIPGEVVSDFSLQDVNTASATYTQAVSPRDFLDQTSVWYFGHAT